MLFIFAIKLILTIPLNGLRTNDLKKTEAVDLTTDNYKETEEDDTLSCDLTENFCDVNCCNDKDCKEADRASFDCSQDMYSEGTSLFAPYICDRVSSKHLEARALLCLHHANSPYLGKFYIEDEPFANDDLPKLFLNRKILVDSFLKPTQNVISIKPTGYYYGSSIYKYEDNFRKASIYLPSNILKVGGFCVKKPIRFMKNSKSSCLYTISENACFTSYIFNLRNFMSPGLIVDSGHNDKITIQSDIHCLRNGSKYVTFSKNVFDVVNSPHNSSNEERKCNGDYSVGMNNGLCQNVVVMAEYSFHRNKTKILAVKIKVWLADVPVSIDSFLKHNKKTHRLAEVISDEPEPYIYLSQSVGVNFFNDEAHEMKNLGYQTRDLLHTKGN